jgi:NADH-ubiquinone oxidoreductase chain 6
MKHLFKIYDITNGFNPIFIDIIILISIISGILIITTKNPIVSVLYLILLFSSVSCYLIFIGLNFLGLAYLLVYVGAVSILFLFILMLINIRVSELLSNTGNSIPLSVLTIIALFVPLNDLLPINNNIFTNEEKVYYVSSNN